MMSFIGFLISIALVIFLFDVIIGCFAAACMFVATIIDVVCTGITGK